MNFLAAAILVALLLLAVFTLVNWSVLSAPATLSFIAFSVEGPLGVILLGAMLFLVVLFVVYALTLRTQMLVESRRHNQELQAQPSTPRPTSATSTASRSPSCAPGRIRRATGWRRCPMPATRPGRT
ncbi:LapA family protein [Thiobacillus sp.]|uniref:LapA family protein n=1 Tax=Thiobacillus sp. TaxID=924 RepID=UPI0025D88BFA|nr:LapA family protein [Thiobacillus sp.]